MLWKNLIVLAGLVWFTTTYAAHPIQSEDMDDALQQKYETPVVKHNAVRGVAQQPEERDPASEAKPVDQQEMKYWRWSDDQKPAKY